MDYPVIGLLHATIGRYTDGLPQLQSTQRTEDPCCRIDERTRSVQGSPAPQSFSQAVVKESLRFANSPEGLRLVQTNRSFSRRVQPESETKLFEPLFSLWVPVSQYV